ncbi:Gfo/Idh/MocA family protein [Pseudoalteromonas mariniglutinosa]|uniref:Gfo/Idh/MocA family protein n=1 Tax=Pseudoalteromonas mariniglutinosa TaxID=206042 RepID=UPI00384ABFAA
MSAKIRFGMIGCGAVTEVKSAPAYQHTAGIELLGVTRRDLAKAHDYAQRHGISQVFASAQALIDSPDIDAVYIATPPDNHKALALMVAKAGKPCCIEKPLAPSYSDSVAIVEAFKHTNTPLFVAYYRRSLPRFNKVKALLEQGAIGSVRHVNWHLSKAPSAQDLSGEYNWRTDKRIARGGYFDDLASHGLDLIAYLLGDFKQVTGLTHNQQNLYQAYDAITANWLHNNGISGTASWNFGCYSREDKLTIYGSKGVLQFSVFDEVDIQLTSAEGVQHFAIANPVHIQQQHVENLATSLHTHHEHPSTGDSALHTSWVMEQILAGVD